MTYCILEFNVFRTRLKVTNGTQIFTTSDSSLEVLVYLIGNTVGAVDVI